MSWVCYLLRCADDTLYCGITNDLEKRLAAHNAGTAAKYTRARGPVVLEFVARLASETLRVNPRAKPMQSALLDKHFLRKHGPGACYGQK